MGAEFSRTTADNLRSISAIQFGVQYKPVDISVWPHLIPLAQWFTPKDARAIVRQLRARTTSNLLTFREFFELLNGRLNETAWPRQVSGCETTSKSKASMKDDSMKTSVPLNFTTHSERKPLLMELYVQHIFHTFKSPNASAERIYVLEFLAALVVVSRGIWALDDKVNLLAELFMDPSSSSRVNENNALPEIRLKETDVALLILCVMRGLAKATVGTALVWKKHGITSITVAKKMAADCMDYIMAGQQVDPKSRRRVAITQQKFVDYVRQEPALRSFLARFAGEELRNPSTFVRYKIKDTGFDVDITYQDELNRHAQLYDSLLRQHVSFQGRSEQRQFSAALLIQSTWRRRCSKLALQHEIQVQEDQRNASASVLQSFAKHMHAFKQLKLAADVERDAYNGGVLVAGSGPCLGIAAKRKGRANTCKSLDFIKAFKSTRLNTCIAAISASPTFALALDENRQTLYAWGRCLPRLYSRDEHDSNNQEDESSVSISLYNAVPRRLAFQFPDSTVESLACGLRHAVALTTDGMVFSWGFNDHGQLGHGSASVFAARTGGCAYQLYYDELTGREQEYLSSPTKLLYFQGSKEQLADPIPIEQVACGDYYCVVLSHDGDVFTWGEASEGQLGHGDAHPAFQVGLVDRYMTNSAYTYLSEPEPVLALSDVCITQVSCLRNHVMALSVDSRMFEWGNWGRRRGMDTEHAFAPVERTDTESLRLRRIAVGDHHTLAEGASVWLTTASSVNLSDGPESQTFDAQASECYLELLPGFLIDAVEQHFVPANAKMCDSMWTCQFVNIVFDNFESYLTTRTTNLDGDSGHSIWTKRIEKMALNSVEDIARFDPKICELLVAGAFPSDTTARNQTREPGEVYISIVKQRLTERIRDQLVIYPRGRDEGYYIQFLLPSDPHSSTRDLPRYDVERTDQSVASQARPTTVEFFVRGSNTSLDTVSISGFATHVYHPSMADDARRIKHQQIRQKKRPTAQPTEINSMFVLEVNEQLLGSWTSTGDGEVSLEETADMDAEVIGGEIMRRVLELQEAGVIIVLVVLDLFDADAFELEFSPDSGIYIPVLMLDVKMRGYTTDGFSSIENPGWWSIYDVLGHMEAVQRRSPQATVSTARPQSAVVLPPPLLARSFFRKDTAALRVEAALSLGAAGILFAKNQRDPFSGGETLPDLDPLVNVTEAIAESHPGKLVALLPYEHARRLRGTVIQQESAEDAISGSSRTLLARESFDVQFVIRPGGTTYAWGDAQNGRLGIGVDLGSGGDDRGGIFRDGYESLTDSAYRFVAGPTRIPALEGVEIAQLECGSAHSLARTVDGKVFTWGRGTRGELGLGRRGAVEAGEDREDQWEPQLVHGLQYEYVSQVAANDQCSLFLTETVSLDDYLDRRRAIAQLKAQAKKMTYVDNGVERVVESR